MRPRIIHNELFVRLQDQDPTIRAAAAYGLGKMKVRRAIKHLAQALHDQTPEVRYHAAWALGAIRDPKAFIYLKAAKLDTDAGVRLAIDHALHRLIPPSTNSLINTLAHHPDSVTRAEAAKMLGTLKEPLALETLVRALADPSVNVRWEAVQAIGSLRPHGDLSLLLAIMATLKDKDAFLRRQSVWALGCLATRGMTKKARDLIGTTLLRALRDPDPQVRGQVATTLGYMEVPHAVPQLMHCLRRDPDPSVRAEATKAVGRLLGWPGLSEPEWNTSYPELPVNDGHSVQKETASLSLVGGGQTGLA